MLGTTLAEGQLFISEGPGQQRLHLVAGAVGEMAPTSTPSLFSQAGFHPIHQGQIHMPFSHEASLIPASPEATKLVQFRVLAAPGLHSLLTAVTRTTKEPHL